MITDGATGEMITLMHTGRTFLKVPPAQTKAMMEQLQKFRTSPDPTKLQPTGKKEKIGEYDCDIFTVALGSLTATYWLAANFPKLPERAGANSTNSNRGTISAMGKGLLPDLKDFPGMPIKTEIDLGGQKDRHHAGLREGGKRGPRSFCHPQGLHRNHFA